MQIPTPYLQTYTSRPTNTVAYGVLSKSISSVGTVDKQLERGGVVRELIPLSTPFSEP